MKTIFDETLEKIEWDLKELEKRKNTYKKKTEYKLTHNEFLNIVSEILKEGI
jgi:hypothetical protein